ncbi:MULTISPECIES: glycosyltransferase family A protein [unclassified Gordonia (in: high G+C Gram-positive bacteria)]|uniref:glycosyltransferase family 2 protein n=1 Tax=unclassified Gordonia (in: high G+C Gram-positive bacteria) TaxID=2657482 RepID=UPI0019669D7E|nr:MULTISPECIES: glycosyltransferase family A protein [unclassified Gordonia (in: high G+C Gram-positive bacteria)]MBN0974529.1 glycosyltransferase family 2 protein [Gordonia sp. BP-119]MBN0984477.1 glycosyltransferase family 2 protein [Gordonia sp. BP-94]
MDSNVRVSAVIPSIGRAELALAVGSVTQQTVPVHPIVVLDRPSAVAKVRRMLEPYEHTLVMSDSVGGAGARNLGVDTAATEYVAFLDDDDQWLPMKTERQLRKMSLSSSVRVLAASGMRFVRRRDEIVIPRESPRAKDIASYLVERPSIRFGDNCVQSSSLIMPREFAAEVRWDESLRKHQDWDFIIRALEFDDADLVWVDDPTLKVYQGSSGSISKSRSWHDSASFYRKHCARMSSRSRADFIWTQLLRSSIAATSIQGIQFSVQELGMRIPHAAAVVVGMSGAASIRPSMKSLNRHEVSKAVDQGTKRETVVRGRNAQH